MKRTAMVYFAVISSIIAASASDGFLCWPSSGIAIGTSTTGEQVFGYNGRSGAASQSTWTFDVLNKEVTQFTEYSEDEMDSGGQVAWINGAGTMVGTIRDMEWAAPQVNGDNNDILENYPLYTACIWKDGELIKLDHNKWEDVATFVAQDGTLPSMSNGFYAQYISEDGKNIAGYLRAFTYMLPVRWTLNDEGEYESTMLTRQTGEFFYLWVGASHNGNRIIMNTSQSGGLSYIWDQDNDPVVFSYSEAGSDISEPVLTALSPNGQYAIMQCYKDGKSAYGVYNFQNGKLDWIPVPEGATSSNWFAANVISDRADGFICDYNYRLHYFNMELGINIPFSSYLAAYGDDIALNGSIVPNKAIARMISKDGRTICGNSLRSSLEEEGWVLRLPETQPMLFALKNCEALFMPDFNLLVKWKSPEFTNGTVIDRYIVTVDGEKNTITSPESDDNGMLRALVPCSGGKHEIEVYAIAIDAAGKEWESVHQSLEVSISPETSLYFFEDLDDSTIDTSVMAYIYAHDTFNSIIPDDSGALSFRLDAGDFCNLTPFWYTCGFSTAEWHTYLESRWFDASEVSEDFYFTWQERNMPINNASKWSDTNRLLLECTVDGENWEVLNESSGAKNGGKWNVRIVDLAQMQGKNFRLRFHSIGAGKVPCEWRIDYYGILPLSSMYAAPEGLMVASETTNKISLAWKNNRGEYEVSYNYNSPMTYNQNVGNEGADLYVACDYGPSKFKAFTGKYITAVSTMLYEPSTAGQDWHTTVEAIIFDEGGNELSRGTLADDAPWYDDNAESIVAILPMHHINLDNPVLIEDGKTYRVAIKISDYAKAMCPIWYFSASDDYIPGVTDLYSDDDLASWDSFSDYMWDVCESEEDFALYGRCIFNIRPCISDAAEIPTEEIQQNQWFYQVYRDGELLPYGIAYYTQQSVIDNNNDGASYTVRSFRRDGTMSLMSDPFIYQGAGISGVNMDPTPEIIVVKVDNGYQVVGDYDSVTVYSIDGRTVGNTSFIDTSVLPHGFYVIVAIKDGRKASHKLGF